MKSSMLNGESATMYSTNQITSHVTGLQIGNI